MHASLSRNAVIEALANRVGPYMLPSFRTSPSMISDEVIGQKFAGGTIRKVVLRCCTSLSASEAYLRFRQSAPSDGPDCGISHFQEALPHRIWPLDSD